MFDRKEKEDMEKSEESILESALGFEGYEEVLSESAYAGLIKDLQEFSKLASRISYVWGESPEEVTSVLEKKYPFKKSFDELSYDMDDWQKAVVKDLKKIY